MLAEMEVALVDAIKTSALGKRLRLVDSLPDLQGDSLIKRFASDAPAVFVALGAFPVKNRAARLKFGLACVARNSRSQQAARHGDGQAIGLYEMMDALMALADGLTAGEVTWQVVSANPLPDEKLYQAGVYAGVVQIETAGEVELPAMLDETLLADFKTFHGDFDLEPHASAAEHQQWLAEPPNHSTTAPDLADTLTLQP